MNLNNDFKKIILTIVRDLFMIAFVLFAASSLLELFKPRIILNYLNLDLFFVLLLVLGVITILFYPATEKPKQKMKFWDSLAVILFSVLVGIFFLWLVKGLGYLSILVGIVGAVICYYFVRLNLESPNEDEIKI